MTTVQNEYAQAFEKDEPFLTYYAINADKSLRLESYTRYQLLNLASKAVDVLRTFGIRQGDSVCHYFTSNTVEVTSLKLSNYMKYKQGHCFKNSLYNYRLYPSYS